MNMSLPLQLQQAHSGRFTFSGIPGTLALRIATPEDAARIQSLVCGLSRDSRYHRFFIPLQELPPELLQRFAHCAPRSALACCMSYSDLPSRQAFAVSEVTSSPATGECGKWR